MMSIVSLFAAGVATSLTPCVYPMIPITAAVISGSSGQTTDGKKSKARTIGLTLSYVAGLALLYATMGLIAGLTGSLFGTVASNPWARFAIGNLLLIFGLAMLDVFPVSAPTKLLTWASNLGGGSYPAVFVLGATSGIVAAPCGAPAFAAVLTYVSTTGSALLGFLYLLVFSIGMTSLLIVVGIFSGAAAILPRSGVWMTWIKRISGVLLIAMAEYYFVQMGMVF
ncbi:MAG TPA: cytochrome c biogenesis protein CcdA [Longimicrobiales bacterium]|nr:cytochrome c biogenesis protein CcdA [Longimicrobiales bacterium]